MFDFVRCTHNGTGGSSTLTLAKSTGFPQPTDVLGTSGTQRVNYVIAEYADATKAVLVRSERGRGSLVLSTNVLTRDEIGVTWTDGAPGTYNANNPTALTFGSTAANIDIMLTATAVSQRPAQPAVAVSIGGSDGYAPFNTRVAIDSSASGVALSAGRRHYIPCEHAYGKAISTVAVNATSIATTGNVRIALYDWGSDGLPGNLIREFTATAQIGINTATGPKSLTLATPFWIPPGWYYLMVQSDAAVQLLFANPYSHCGAGQVNGRDILMLYRDTTYGAAPAVADNLAAMSGVLTRSNFPQLAVFIK